MIEIKNIVKKYDKFKLNNINFTINKGEFVSLIGESGCGKTTILKLISGITDDFTGEIFFNGEDIKNKSPQKRGISFVFQESLLFPNMTVEENIGFGLKVRKHPKPEIKDKVFSLLKEVELEGFENRYPNELSGGQKQRIAIARALVVKPKLLLMDEPFSALDTNLRVNMHQFLKKLQKKNNITILFVTHDKDEAFYLSDRIAIMNKGKIVQFDTVKNLTTKPKDTFVAKFLGMKNIIKVNVENSLINPLNIKTTKVINGNYNLLLKKEKIVLKEDENIENKENTYSFKVNVLEKYYKSGFYHYKVDFFDHIIEIIQSEDIEIEENHIFNIVINEESFIFIS